jgi:signal transduction histidine kinase
VGRLASQTASQKLAQILGLLILPVLVLWLIFFQHIKGEIDVLNREQQGLNLAEAVLPVVFDGAVAAEAPEIAELEAAIGIEPSAGAATLFADKATSRTDRLKTASAYLNAVAQKSALVLDSDAQSSALVDAGFVYVPNYLAEVSRLNESEMLLLGEGRAPSLRDPSVLLVVGQMQATLKKLGDALVPLGAAGFNTPNEKQLLNAFFAVDRHLDKVAMQFSQVDVSDTQRRTTVQEFQTATELFLHVEAPLIAKQLHIRLRENIEQRQWSAWGNFVFLTLAALASTLAGIGLAVMMMRSTLVKLDEVELARSEAQTARLDAEGMAVNLSNINSDISRLNKDLADKVKSLNEVQDELIKKGRMEQLGQLTATIAHEIRNPLGAIRTTAFLLNRKITAKGLEADGLIERINNGVNRCDAIISQLLDYSRTKELNCSSGLLDEWLTKVVREEAGRLPSDIMIECSLGLEGVQVAFDPARLERAINNLLSNAVEAMSSTTNEGQMRSSNVQACVWVSTFRHGDGVAIRVSDNGPGISQDNLDRIREPLFTTKSFGTGLGLPAVEQIIKQHGGHLDISSEPGRGAIFTLNLPLIGKKLEAA